MKTVSYTYDVDKGLPVEQLHGGITLIDDIAHVKVWKTGGRLCLCVIPKYGRLEDPGKVPVHGKNNVEGHYTIMVSTGELIPARKPGCRHEWQHPAPADRRPSNWCPHCRDWFVPSRFA